MAATDTLDNFLKTISTEDKERLNNSISNQRAEMFAARSEDARVRLVHDFIRHVRESLNAK